MNVEIVLGVVALVLIPTVAALGAARIADGRNLPDREPRFGNVGRVIDTATNELGRAATSAIVLLAGLAVTVAVCWVLGRGAHAIQGAVDVPFFHWTDNHQTKSWTDVWWNLTTIGSPKITQRLVVVGAILLAVVWRKQRWWLPGTALVIGYVFEKYGQIILKTVVHRGHPPFCAGTGCITFGTWPSGGCARVLVVYGLIAYFCARSYKSGRSARAWSLAVGLVGLALTIQAYARLNNMEHWLTDVLGGCVYGVMLLTVLVAGAEVIQRRAAGRHRPLGEGGATGDFEREIPADSNDASLSQRP